MRYPFTVAEKNPYTNDLDSYTPLAGIRSTFEIKDDHTLYSYSGDKNIAAYDGVDLSRLIEDIEKSKTDNSIKAPFIYKLKNSEY